ncbi:YceI family protein [Streptacidiphilus sp. ASG 303]|uniref:YceI family protein n=1 Tax=Streptacidiphilus sp. ASG 303 TaxID=2896847 RepID=UPI001E28C268|nr:YceI family protein [Streptacidiphilus sp. ASG 303]MCD0485137.1 YceI family protein [Streptacidiphilus sp. ASG 303]
MMSDTGATAWPEQLTGRWTLDVQRTRVAFRLKKLGFIRVAGTLPVAGGTLDCAPGGRPVRLEVRMAAAGFTTGNPQRDRAVRGRGVLDAEGHPEITFTAGSAEPDGDSWRVTGELTVRGVSAPQVLTVEAADPAPTGEPRFRATAVVDRTAVGVTALRGIAGRLVEVEIEAVLSPAP